MEDAYYWAALQSGLALRQGTLLLLYRYFGSGRAVLEAGAAEFRQVPRLTGRVRERIITGRGSLDPRQTFRKLSSRQIRVTSLGEQDYPRFLAEIHDPPVVLYYRGRLPVREMPLLAVVGARRATPYGRAMAKRLAAELTCLGWGIVSGMARGIDTAAHQGALAGQGYTLAVLGCGVDVCYPRENQKLYAEIVRTGCVLSEFPPGTPPLAQHFPLRNRIISGCSLGTLVVEAGERSGALITAQLALEEGREVFAVPGSITSPCSHGTHRLIKEGAKLVEGVRDVLEEYPFLNFVLPESGSGRPEEVSLPPEEAAVYRHLSLEPVQVDQLAGVTGLPVATISGILTLLELKGLAKRLPGHYYICTDLPKNN